MVERLIRTWRSANIRYFEAANTRDWASTYLEQFVQNYNNRPHSTTGEKPVRALEGGDSAFQASARIKAQHEKRRQRVRRDLKPVPENLTAGHFVKIARKRGIFDKEADPRGNFGEEVFRIRLVSRAQTLPVWYLTDLKGERISGSFYREEIAPYYYNENALFVVEKVLKRRKRGRNLELFVSWRGYGDEFNSWLNARDVNML
jgi:hypothetical protein